MKRDYRSGTRHHHPETDIVVAIRRMIVVTIDRARIHMIVEPRAAPQVRYGEPHSSRCRDSITAGSFMCKNEKKSERLTALRGLALRACASRTAPSSVQRGTRHHQPDTDKAEANRRMIEVTKDRARIHKIVEPRAAPQDATFSRPQILFTRILLRIVVIV